MILMRKLRSCADKTQKAFAHRWRIGNMSAHKNRIHDRCRIATARLEIRQILRTAF